MFRWPLLIIGLVLITLSIIMQFKYQPLPEEPETIDLKTAVKYSKGGFDKYVEFPMEIDTVNAIYGTSVRKPTYSKLPTDREYDLLKIKERDEYIGRYVGTVISMKNVLAGPYLMLQAIIEKDDTKKVLRERLLAQVNERIWVLSPLFKKEDKQLRDKWLNKVEYKGGLINFDELLEVVDNPKIENKLSDIRGAANRDLKIFIPDQAYIIVDGYGTDHIPVAYYPVKGSDFSLFYIACQDKKVVHIKNYKGILESKNSTGYSNLAKILKTKFSPKIGLLLSEASTSYNQRKKRSAGETSTFGGIFLILGLIGFGIRWVKKLKYKKQ